MAQAKKFKSNTGGHVSIFVDWREVPLEVQATGVYETSDKAEIQAFQDSPEVVEVKAKKEVARKAPKDPPEVVEVKARKEIARAGKVLKGLPEVAEVKAEKEIARAGKALKNLPEVAEVKGK